MSLPVHLPLDCSTGCGFVCGTTPASDSWMVCVTPLVSSVTGQADDDDDGYVAAT
jgi:hypothetical protein